MDVKMCVRSSCSLIRCAVGVASTVARVARGPIGPNKFANSSTRITHDAKRVTLVCDNLNTHDIASLYTAFDAPTAHRLAKRLRIEYTPRNGSWLNMAEMELSVLTRQCIGRRFDNNDQMQRAMKRWQRDRNKARCRAAWRFTTADARNKLQRLYPQTDV